MTIGPHVTGGHLERTRFFPAPRLPGPVEGPISRSAPGGRGLEEFVMLGLVLARPNSSARMLLGLN